MRPTPLGPSLPASPPYSHLAGMAGAATSTDGRERFLNRLAEAANCSPPDDFPLELLEELHSTLQKEAEGVTSGVEDIDDTLFSDPFLPLNLLFPLLSHDPSSYSVTASATASLLLFANQSSGKEIAMAVGEKVDELKAPQAGTDEDEDDWEDEHGGQGTGSGPSPWDPRDAAVKLAVLIQMYSLALPRVNTARPLKFLTPALESLLPAILDLILEGAFREPGHEPIGLAPPGEEVSSGSLALNLLASVAGFVETFVKGSWLDSPDEDFRPMGHVLLSSLLMDSIGLLHPFLPSSNLASDFFYSRFSRLRPPPGRTRVTSMAVDEAEIAQAEKLWQRIDILLPTLRIFPHALPTLANSRLSATPSRIGAFVLLVHHLALSTSSASPPYSSPLSETPSELVSQTLGVLKMPFDSAMNRVGEDERLWWMWWCVERQVAEGKGEGLEEEVLFPLVELVSTLASLSPSPQTRYLSFRLLSRLILRCTPSSSPSSSTAASSSSRDGRETIQMIILKTLVSKEETPFEQLRVAAVGLVKEVMGEKLTEAEQASPTSTAPPSLFLTPLFLSEFSSVLFTLPFSFDRPFTEPSAADHLSLTAEEFVEQHFPATMERLGLYYFLLKRDQRNLIGLASPSTRAVHERSLLSPLRTQLDAWLSSPVPADEQPGVRLQLEVVRDRVGRVDETIAGIPSSGVQ